MHLGNNDSSKRPQEHSPEVDIVSGMRLLEVTNNSMLLASQ